MDLMDLALNYKDFKWVNHLRKIFTESNSNENNVSSFINTINLPPLASFSRTPRQQFFEEYPRDVPTKLLFWSRNENKVNIKLKNKHSGVITVLHRYADVIHEHLIELYTEIGEEKFPYEVSLDYK